MKRSYFDYLVAKNHTLVYESTVQILTGSIYLSPEYECAYRNPLDPNDTAYVLKIFFNNKNFIIDLKLFTLKKVT